MLTLKTVKLNRVLNTCIVKKVPYFIGIIASLYNITLIQVSKISEVSLCTRENLSLTFVLYYFTIQVHCIYNKLNSFIP